MSKASTKVLEHVTGVLAQSNIAVADFDERLFPDENWLILRVAEESLLAAQTMVGSLESSINELTLQVKGSTPWVITFRPFVSEAVEVHVDERRLSNRRVDQLIQLLEARSRTSDALPSLNYVEDPRASLAAVDAPRHHLIYGRRGVGKTAILLEAKRSAERQGHVAVWSNAHTVRHLKSTEAFAFIAEQVLNTLLLRAGDTTSSAVGRLTKELGRVAKLRSRSSIPASAVDRVLPDLNAALRGILRPGLFRLYVYVDDFYLLPVAEQPAVLDYLAGMLRDCDGWLKVASIERLTRPFEPSTRYGLEVPHDASVIDLDVTLEDPGAAQNFLQSVLSDYTKTAGLKAPSSIAKREALGRLVLASGGVPRDYLNLFAASIVIARSARQMAKEVGKEDVAKAAGVAAKSKKRDLDQDVNSEYAGDLLRMLEQISSAIKIQGFTYFLIQVSQKELPAYERIGQIVDLRFAHLLQSSLSDQHRPGVRYEAYILDLSEFADIRLKRGLSVLDIDAGRWTHRLSGKANTAKVLTGTQLRDQLRQAPVLDLSIY